MVEAEKSFRDFDPIFVRDSVVKGRLRLWETTLAKMHWTNSSYPFVAADIEALKEIGSLKSRGEFDDRLETLGKKHFDLRMAEREQEAGLVGGDIKETQAVYECMRFIWGDQTQLDLGALFSTQRAVNYPLWSENWQFTEQAKPPHTFSEDYGRLNEFYQRLEAGSLVRVRPDLVAEHNLTEGIDGEVLGFKIGLQARWNMDYLIVSFKDQSNWIHQRYLHQLELDLNQT